LRSALFWNSTLRKIPRERRSHLHSAEFCSHQSKNLLISIRAMIQATYRSTPACHDGKM